MYNFDSFKERSERHIEAHIKGNKTYIKDPACVICYPPEGTIEKFNKFWNWYKSKFPALTYTEYTTRIFQDILNRNLHEKGETQKEREQTETKLLNLVGSIKYSTEPEQTIPRIVGEIIKIIIRSENFKLKQTEQKHTEQIETEQTENYYETETEQENIYDELEQPEINIYDEIERTLKNWEKDINTRLENTSKEKSDSEESKETTELINTEDLELTSEAESEETEYNLNLLFEQNLINMAEITRDEMVGLFHGVFGAHGENLRPIMKVKEFYGRDDEDPHEWCAEFEKACAANGWSGNDNNIRRKDIASSYLRGNATEWYETDQANIVQWHIDG